MRVRSRRPSLGADATGDTTREAGRRRTDSLGAADPDRSRTPTRCPDEVERSVKDESAEQRHAPGIGLQCLRLRAGQEVFYVAMGWRRRGVGEGAAVAIELGVDEPGRWRVPGIRFSRGGRA